MGKKILVLDRKGEKMVHEILGTKKFGAKEVLPSKNVGPIKWWLRKLGPKCLVKIGAVTGEIGTKSGLSYSWDYADMDNCCQDICCLDKCYFDSWHLLKLPVKFGQNRISNSWDIPDVDKCNQDKCCMDNGQMSPRKLASVKDGPRNLPLKFWSKSDQ